MCIYNLSFTIFKLSAFFKFKLFYRFLFFQIKLFRRRKRAGTSPQVFLLLVQILYVFSLHHIKIIFILNSLKFWTQIMGEHLFGMGKKIQNHRRNCTRATLSTRRFSTQNYLSRFETQQHPIRQRYEPQNIGFWFGKTMPWKPNSWQYISHIWYFVCH